MRSTNERRLSILEYLCDAGYEKIANLMSEFQVSRSTIIRDLQILSISCPIYTVQGKGGGVHIVEGYNPGLKYLKPSQVDLLNRISMDLEQDERQQVFDIINAFAKKIKSS